MARLSLLPPVKDDLYYFGPWIILQVEQTLFQVPRKDFQEHSEIFADMFTVPPIKDAKKDGQSDDQPLRLEGITAEDFRSFLKALFPRPAYHGDTPDTDKELEVALRLATTWHFATFREHLIKRLEAMNLVPARRLQLSRTYDINKWNKSALRELALRDSSLTLAEASQIGLEFAVTVSMLRDERYEGIVKETIVLSRNTYYGSEIGQVAMGKIEGRIDAKLASLVETRRKEGRAAIV